MVECPEVVTTDEELLLLNLWQLYMHDLSEFRGSVVAVDGRYRDDRLKTYFSYQEHWAYLIKANNETAGFALIRKSHPDTYLMGEFFILRKFRRFGIGRTAAQQLISAYSGKWEIPFQNENPKAARFWRQLVAALGYQSSEELIAVEGKDHLPPDVWLRFTS